MFAAVHFFNRLMPFVWADSLRRVPNKSRPGAVLLGWAVSLYTHRWTQTHTHTHIYIYKLTHTMRAQTLSSGFNPTRAHSFSHKNSHTHRPLIILVSSTPLAITTLPHCHHGPIKWPYICLTVSSGWMDSGGVAVVSCYASPPAASSQFVA